MDNTARLFNIISITPGGFHCWCDSSAGVVRKNNSEVSDRLWYKFFNKNVEEKVYKSKEGESFFGPSLCEIDKDIKLREEVKKRLSIFDKILIVIDELFEKVFSIFRKN